MTAALSDKPTEDSSGMDLLRIYQNRLIELNLDLQLIKQSLKMGPDMNANEKEVPFEVLQWIRCKEAAFKYIYLCPFSVLKLCWQRQETLSWLEG